MAKILIAIITAYQKVSRLFLLPCCRFHPSCSSYACQAIEKYGAAKGVALAIGRILRCSPLSVGGFDPVK